MTTLTYDAELSRFDTEQGRFGCWKDIKLFPPDAARISKKRTALISCPKCGRVATLSGRYIFYDGNVTPDFVCAAEGCGFHDYIKLEGWLP